MILALIASLTLSAVNYQQSVPVLTHEGDVIGSGVLVEKRKVLTAAHVVDFPPPDAVICGDKVIDVIKITMAMDSDLAIMHLNRDCGAAPVKIANRNPNLGDDLYISGCPQGFCGWVTRGVATAYQELGRHLFLMHDGKTWFGNSGGPVLNKNGELVAITHGVLCFNGNGLQQCYSAATPLQFILNLLENN